MISDALIALRERVREASARRMPLRIRAGGTKDFYGNIPHGEILDPRNLCGIVAYEPSELVITARAGTRLADLQSTLAEHGQMLAFEPPHFGEAATVGGCVAAGIAGPRRAAHGFTCGAVRDFVLGARLIDGRGGCLRFGGTVMKNVAGYDVARVLAGSLGILGIIVDVSFKVLPIPIAETSLQFEMDEAAALRQLNVWGGQALPISASCWTANILTMRLSGAEPAVSFACSSLGGIVMDTQRAAAFWRDLREHVHPFFSGSAPLWRLSLPSTAAPVSLNGVQLIEWDGAQRWIRCTQPPQEIRAAAQHLRGHATLFRGGNRSQGVFTPLSPPLERIHQRLKAHFDPAGIFNPGRMFDAL